MHDRLRTRRTLPFDQTTNPPVESGGEGYAMLKLLQDATAPAVDGPETLTMDLDELCR